METLFPNKGAEWRISCFCFRPAAGQTPDRSRRVKALWCQAAEWQSACCRSLKTREEPWHYTSLCKPPHCAFINMVFSFLLQNWWKPFITCSSLFYIQNVSYINSSHVAPKSTTTSAEGTTCFSGRICQYNTRFIQCLWLLRFRILLIFQICWVKDVPFPEWPHLSFI